MLTIPHWVLDPASPQTGEAGPITIRAIEEAPTDWPVCAIPGSLGRRMTNGEIVQRLEEDDIAAARLIATAPKMQRRPAGIGSMGSIHRRAGCPLLARGGARARGGRERASAYRRTVRFTAAPQGALHHHRPQAGRRPPPAEAAARRAATSGRAWSPNSSPASTS